MAVEDWDPTASNNASVGGINVAEGCPPGNMNNAIREMMAELRMMFASWAFDFLDGTSPLPVAQGGTGATSLATIQVPTGMKGEFFGSTAPAGWLEANGASVSRITYAALWAYAQASGNMAADATDKANNPGKFYVGNGSTTFDLPDVRGEFFRAWDHGRGVDSGRTLGSAQADELKSHTHTTPADIVNAQGHGGSFPTVPQYTAGTATGATGGAETRPRNVALLVCIKT